MDASGQHAHHIFGTVAAILCLATTLTDLRHVYNMPDPQVSVSLAEVKRLAPMTGSKEQATLTFSMDADLRSVFSWNTKQLFLFLQAEYGTPDSTVNQVVLWDTIIQQKEKARIRLKNHKTKYSFIHPSKGLKGAQVNLTLVWHVMPRVGFMYTQSRTFPGDACQTSTCSSAGQEAPLVIHNLRAVPVSNMPAHSLARTA